MEVEGANTLEIPLEYALVITFLYSRTYECNEYCKYYKNAENPHYKFIPFVHRTHYDGSVTHVTGIVHITPEDHEAMPSRFDGDGSGTTIRRSRCRWTGSSRRSSRNPTVSWSATCRSSGYRSTYRARNATNRAWRRARPRR